MGLTSWVVRTLIRHACVIGFVLVNLEALAKPKRPTLLTFIQGDDKALQKCLLLPRTSLPVKSKSFTGFEYPLIVFPVSSWGIAVAASVVR